MKETKLSTDSGRSLGSGAEEGAPLKIDLEIREQDQALPYGYLEVGLSW